LEIYALYKYAVSLSVLSSLQGLETVVTDGEEYTQKCVATLTQVAFLKAASRFVFTNRRANLT